MAAAYPAGPPPITIRSNFSMNELRSEACGSKNTK
jgi:hypothetical protein